MVGGGLDLRETIGDDIPTNSARSTLWQSDEASSKLAINCIGKAMRLSFVAVPEATVPLAAKAYKIDRSSGELVVMARAGDKLLANLTGTIEITAFDDRHVAGTVELVGTNKGRYTMTGTFEFPCRGRGCAAR